jgi:hypothetical protein
MAKQRVHKFILTVTMNKKCLRRTALREVRDNVHGEHFCTELEDGDPDTFRIRSITNTTSRRKY